LAVRRGAHRHQESELFLGYFVRVDHCHQFAVVHDCEPVGEAAHLIELRGDQEHRSPCLPQAEQLFVDELHTSHVHPAGGVGGDNGFGVAVELPADDELLLIAPREGFRGRACLRRANVVLVDDVGRVGLRPAPVDAAAGGEGPVVLAAQQPVLHEVVGHHQSSGLSVLGDVGHPRFDPLTARAMRYLAVTEVDTAGRWRPNARHCLDEF